MDLCMSLNVSRFLFAKKLSLRKEVATFDKTVDGHGREPSFSNVTGSHQEEYIQMSFMTTPGRGQWEVTFTLVDDDKISVNLKQISRTNMYGNAPSCIIDIYPHLRPFCYCKGYKP